jgi:hypothetical protein
MVSVGVFERIFIKQSEPVVGSFCCCVVRQAVLSHSVRMIVSMWMRALVAYVTIVSVLCDDQNLPAFHFVPYPLGWMNGDTLSVCHFESVTHSHPSDPCGPFVDKNTGIYHLFYQYLTPRSWGHAISYDLLNWEILPIALLPDESYDEGGVYTGSVTTTSDGTPLILYSVWTNDKMCLATPANSSDPKLQVWSKYR